MSCHRNSDGRESISQHTSSIYDQQNTGKTWLTYILSLETIFNHSEATNTEYSIYKDAKKSGLVRKLFVKY